MERWWVGLVTLLVVLACVCSAVGIVGIWSAAQQPAQPQPAEQAPLTGKTAPGGTIAYVGTDGNLYTILPDGSRRQAVTDDQPAEGGRYNTLAWSLDGQLAFMTLTRNESALFTVQPDGARTRVYSGRPTAAPFYLYWSPDGQRIAFLTASQQGQMALWLAKGRDDDSAQTIATGSPSYFSWSPDSQSLLMHVGGAQSESKEARLAVFRAPSETTRLPDAPGTFQAPAWSPEGKRFLFVRENDDGNDELILAQDDQRDVLASSRTGLVFALSPQGNRVAFARPNSQAGFLYESIAVLDLDKKEQRVVARGQAAAFFWSPDGSQLAVLSIDDSNRRPQGRRPVTSVRSEAAPLEQTSPVRLAWSIVHTADGAVDDAVSFHPTDSFLLLIPYFDQYAQSLSLWSPDSRYLVYSDLGPLDQPSIRVLDTTQPQQPARRLADGSFAAWSWH